MEYFIIVEEKCNKVKGIQEIKLKIKNVWNEGVRILIFDP